MEMQWWVWIVLGFTLTALEMFTLTFFVLWFGIAALLVGVVTLVWPEMPIAAQVLVWGVLSALLAVLWFKVFKNRTTDNRWTAAEFIGEVGLLTAAVSEFQKGKVRFPKPILGNEEWVCTSSTDIPSDERVRIISINGNTLHVDKA